MSTNDVSSKSGLTWGHSTSLKMASFKFNGSYFATYQSAILTIALNRTIFTIFDIVTMNLCTICTLLKSTDPGPSFFAGDTVGTSSFTSTESAPKKSYIAQGGALRPFKIIQDHRNWYQSKARM